MSFSSSAVVAQEMVQMSWLIDVKGYLAHTELYEMENRLLLFSMHEFLELRPGSQNIRDYCQLKKTRNLKEFSAFLCMRRCKGQGSLKSFL